MTDLTRITGIGPGLASQMIAAGIPDAEALAKAHPSDIVIVRGVGAATAPVLIARAKQITAPTPDPASQSDRDAAVARPAAKTTSVKKKRSKSVESKGKDDAKKDAPSKAEKKAKKAAKKIKAKAEKKADKTEKAARKAADKAEKKSGKAKAKAKKAAKKLKLQAKEIKAKADRKAKKIKKKAAKSKA